VRKVNCDCMFPSVFGIVHSRSSGNLDRDSEMKFWARLQSLAQSLDYWNMMLRSGPESKQSWDKILGHGPAAIMAWRESKPEPRVGRLVQLIDFGGTALSWRHSQTL
jgi:hypothetical protein